MHRQCNLTIGLHRFVLTRCPRACLRFNHVHSKCLFRFSVFPPCGLCKLEKSHCGRESKGGFSLANTDGKFSLGPPCLSWLLFQTISTSLIILISHFYTWIPLFSISPMFFSASFASEISAPSPPDRYKGHILSWNGQGFRNLHCVDREKSLLPSRIIQRANFFRLSHIKCAPR